ncbi:hypothetical protein MMOR_42810 [Mycolicibacterium moriokaense]|jgi:NAD(P)-dependent dehydrogenase (short-subunit alcohol dehydrogenase family)|uniref:SDR family NAD(P)-dependent oxidoreductase n=1 Tax=Mycolicibacterium moriokaense TaxID=39691 RepID=A0AAD1M8B3_9MYCO|nr:hypothetical protein MMOR_42810 [Mycolicibacterium moriokaense]
MATDTRSIVITGASRGLGFASAARLYDEGWRVVAAMRNPERGMSLLRAATGAAANDDRLIRVQLDLTDSASIAAAAMVIDETGIPRQGAVRGGAVPLASGQRAMVAAAKVLPPAALQRMASFAMRIAPTQQAPDRSESND